MIDIMLYYGTQRSYVILVYRCSGFQYFQYFASVSFHCLSQRLRASILTTHPRSFCTTWPQLTLPQKVWGTIAAVQMQTIFSAFSNSICIFPVWFLPFRKQINMPNSEKLKPITLPKSTCGLELILSNFLSFQKLLICSITLTVDSTWYNIWIIF